MLALPTPVAPLGSRNAAAATRGCSAHARVTPKPSVASVARPSRLLLLGGSGGAAPLPPGKSGHRCGGCGAERAKRSESRRSSRTGLPGDREREQAHRTTRGSGTQTRPRPLLLPFCLFRRDEARAELRRVPVLVLLPDAARWRAPRGGRRASPSSRSPRRRRADRDRRDELRVAADEGPRVDRRRVLLNAVVVAEDRARADVRAFADDAVAEVREVVRLRARPMRVFFVSTKLPTCASSPMSLSGRRCEKGPTCGARADPRVGRDGSTA